MVLTTITIALYLVALISLIYLVRSRNNHTALVSAISSISAALIAHAALLSHQIIGFGESIDIGALKALSLTAFIMVLVLFPKIKRLPNTAIALTLFATGAVGLSLFQSQHQINLDSLPLGAHIITSIVSYAILMLAAIQALLIILRDRALKSPKSSFLTRNLPPILRMERWLFQLVTIGFLLLTLSLITSFFFLDHWFTKSTIHKTVLTLAAWFLFGGVMIAHYRYHVRGVRVAKFIIISSLVLLMAITGTRLIQEVIFNRT